MPVLEEVPSAPICVCGSFIEGHSLEYLSSPQAVMSCPCSSSPWALYKARPLLAPWHLLMVDVGWVPYLTGHQFSARNDPSDYMSEVKQIKKINYYC